MSRNVLRAGRTESGKEDLPMTLSNRTFRLEPPGGDRHGLTLALGWEAVFFVNVPLAAVALVLSFALIPADGQRAVGRKVDLPGAFSATLGVTLLVFALVQGPNLGGGSPGILATA